MAQITQGPIFQPIINDGGNPLLFRLILALFFGWMCIKIKYFRDITIKDWIDHYIWVYKRKTNTNIPFHIFNSKIKSSNMDNSKI